MLPWTLACSWLFSSLGYFPVLGFWRALVTSCPFPSKTLPFFSCSPNSSDFPWPWKGMQSPYLLNQSITLLHYLTLSTLCYKEYCYLSSCWGSGIHGFVQVALSPRTCFHVPLSSQNIFLLFFMSSFLQTNVPILHSPIIAAYAPVFHRWHLLHVFLNYCVANSYCLN